MKKSEFIGLLDSPINVGAGDIVNLQESIKEFPYFQSAQVLLTKAFHVTENINFENQLKKTAAFAADRKKLHQLIFDEQVAFEEPIIPEPIVEVPPPIQAVQESLLNKAFTPDFSAVSEVDESTTLINEEQDRILQQQVLSEAIHHSILLEVDDEIPSFEPDFKSSTEIHEEKLDVNPQEVNRFNEEVAHSFSDWLNFYNDEEKEHTASNLLWNNTSEFSREAIKTFSPSSNLPVKQEFYSAAKMAKLSVQEDDDLVTETLANVYVQQGYPEKAIKAFEKLQLKYPEKKVYFAGRIKEIENQINSY